MSFSYTAGSSRPTHQVRALIPDTSSTTYVFQDEELEGYLMLEGGNVRRAAAMALEVAASDKALVQGVVKTLNLSVDGAAAARALMERAALLREQSATRQPRIATAGSKLAPTTPETGLSFLAQDPE